MNLYTSFDMLFLPLFPDITHVHITEIFEVHIVLGRGK